MIVLYLLICGTILLILFSNIRISIYNIENTNYIRVKFLIFTLYINDDRIINIIRSFGIGDNANIRKTYKNYKNISPLAKSIMQKIIVNEAFILKFVSSYTQTYKMITLYVLSSYFKSYLTSNMRKLENYKYDLVYSKTRDDIDFSFKFKISIINVVFSVLTNLECVFKNKKRSLVNGS